jgi:predicted RNase H-like HicB family nuclease
VNRIDTEASGAGLGAPVGPGGDKLQVAELELATVDGTSTVYLGRQNCLTEVQGMILRVLVKRGEDGYFVASCPSLKSCWSQGQSREEALRNMQEAISLYLEAPPNGPAHDETQEVVELTL